jgi:hypothetical protein
MQGILSPKITKSGRRRSGLLLMEFPFRERSYEVPSVGADWSGLVWLSLTMVTKWLQFETPPPSDQWNCNRLR